MKVFILWISISCDLGFTSWKKSGVEFVMWLSIMSLLLQKDVSYTK
jgi:hypothetical protein